MTRLLALVLCLCGMVVAAHAQSPDAQTIFEQANASFSAAVELWDTDRAAAEASLADAVAGYDALRTEFGVSSSALFMNLGNAHLLRDDLGRAVLNYLRARRLAPDDARIDQSLAYASSLTRSEIPPSAEDRAERVLLAWRGEVSPRAVFIAGVACIMGVWVVLIARAIGVRVPTVPAVGVLLVIAGVCFATLALEDAAASRDLAVVIADDGATGYNGPSEAVYEPTFTEPIFPGVVVEIVESRGPWNRVRLPNAAETWLRTTEIESVW